MAAIPQSLKNLWDIWTLRGVVLLSLFFQAALTLLSPNRKHFSQKKFAFIIWVAYLLADIIADYAVGLIFSVCSGLSDDDRDLLVLWSAFLIVHLGGPDTITALALEDNELWLRHLLMLIFQAGATLYVFSQSLPNNKLMIPMILMFISGCIKYLERTCSLYFAHGDRFPSAGPNYRRLLYTDFESLHRSLSGQFDDLELVKAAYRLFGFYRGQFFDLIYSIEDYGNGSYLFNRITATTALRLMEMELNFMYDILFTKAVVVHSFMGFFFRFFSFCCLIASLAIFRFHITKHGVFNEINVAVTYVLFLGAVALEIIAFLMAVLSDWTLLAIIDSKESEGARADDPEGAQSEDQEGSRDQNWWRRFVAQVSNFVEPTFGKIWSYWRKFVAQVSNFVELTFGKIWSYWTPRWYPVEGAQPEDEELRMPLLFRRWSGCLSRHNLIRHCLKGQPSDIPIVNAMNWVIDQVGLRELLDQMTPLPREPLRKNLWNLIFEYLQKKSRFVNRHGVYERRTAYQFVSAKGEWVLQDKSDLDGELRKNLKRYIDDWNEKLRNNLKRYIDGWDEELSNNLKGYIDDSDDDLCINLKRYIDDSDEDLRNNLKRCIDGLDLRNNLMRYIGDLYGVLLNNHDPYDDLLNNLERNIVDLRNNLKRYIDDLDEDLRNNLKRYIGDSVDDSYEDLLNNLERYIGVLDEDLRNNLKRYIDDSDEDLRNNLKRYIGDLDEDLRNNSKGYIDDSDEALRNRLKRCIDDSVEDLRNNLKRSIEDSDKNLRNNLKRYIGDLDKDLRKKLKRYIDAPFDESLLLWHVATELLYNKNPPNDVSKNNAEMSKILSDYMMYLLIMQPNLMAAVGAIGKKRFQDTCEAAKEFFVEEKLGPSQQVEACGRILVADSDDLHPGGHENKSVLREATWLAEDLQKLGYKKWEIIIQVWVELLCHAAAHGGGKAHAQQLSKGGELITFVWLLMSHFGFGKD